MPMMSIEPINTCRRPMRSESRPPTIAPMNKPNVAALNTHDVATGLSPNAGISFGAATPIDWLSKPSNSAATTHKNKVLR